MKPLPETTVCWTSDDQRWEAVQARCRAADAHFVYAVRTTGVWCRPSAATRLPKRKNVEFFDTALQAEKAGYRASQRKTGDKTAMATQRAMLMTKACQQISAAECLPALSSLATAAGMSPCYFHRLFKAETGLTPKAWGQALRAQRLRATLNSPESSVTQAIYDAGFNSTSSFYAASHNLLGMRARDYRDGGVNAQIRFAVGECSLGAILVAQSQYGICAIMLGDCPDVLVRNLQDKFPHAQLTGGDTEFDTLVAHVVGFIEAPSIGLDLPLDMRGTAFQERVWQALRAIPVGTTVSYSEIAEHIGAPKAVRAVARACATNSIAVAIPCHRVVCRNGDISGYRWGVERKRALLLREATLQDSAHIRAEIEAPPPDGNEQ